MTADVEPTTRSRPGGVFISYRRADAEAEARYLSDTLGPRVGRDRVFIDTVSLAPGDAWLERLHQAVDACSLMLVVIGPGWNPASGSQARGRLFEPDDVVRAEVARGLAGERRVIPILVRGAQMPQVDDLPEGLQALPGRQAVVVEDGLWTYEAQRLAAAVEGLIGAADRGPTAGFSASSVIGREDLLTSLETTLVTERLVTLVGAGGCGKTTVATSLVERVAATARATIVDLTVVRDPARVPRAIADAVGATDAEVDEELDAVARLMRARGDTLLAIDN